MIMLHLGSVVTYFTSHQSIEEGADRTTGKRSGHESDRGDGRTRDSFKLDTEQLAKHVTALARNEHPEIKYLLRATRAI
jgi:hypothetical protein